jgi:sarcosine oxidase
VNADVVVVGAGVMGAATARAVAKRGHDVVLLERFHLGHAHGSSHGASRIFRFSYADPAWVAMAQRALPLWRELEQESGEQLLHTTGGLDVGPPAEANAAAIRACGAEAEFLDGAEAAARFPTYAFDRGERVLYQPDAGVLRAEAIVRALVVSAVGHGAELREGTEVLSLTGARVETTDGGIEARTVVVTAGAWAPQLVGLLPVRATRETIAYFPDVGGLFPPLVEWQAPARYCLPDLAGGVKAGLHHAGPEWRAASEPDATVVARAASWIRRRVPAAGPAERAETCLYTNTPDESFVLERRGAVVVGCACSGHAFKFAPLIGEQLARLAIER